MEYGSALADELEDHPDEPEPTSDGDEEKIKEKTTKTIRLLLRHVSSFRGLQGFRWCHPSNDIRREPDHLRAPGQSG